MTGRPLTLLLVACFLLVVDAQSTQAASRANRLAYLNSPAPLYFGPGVPGLAATQWRGEHAIADVVLVDISRVRRQPSAIQRVLESLNEHPRSGQVIRSDDGADRTFEIVDLNRDGALDLVVLTPERSHTLLWSAKESSWKTIPFPAVAGPHQLTWGVLRADGAPTVLIRSLGRKGAWHFVDEQWVADHRMTRGLQVEGRRIFTGKGKRDEGVRLRDLDGDGVCELIVSSSRLQATLRWSEEQSNWQPLPFTLPDGHRIVGDDGNDSGLRFVDVDQDGDEDIVVSNEDQFAVYVFESLETGWSQKLLAGRRTGRGEPELPAIAEQGRATGAWYDASQLLIRKAGERPSESTSANSRSLIQMKLIELRLHGLQKTAIDGFAKLVHNDGDSDEWYDYRGEKVPNYHLRQTKVGAKLVWETPRAGDAKSNSSVDFVFLGALGFESQPQTEGYALDINGVEALRFDVTRNSERWRSGDGQVELLFRTTWSSSLDAAGFFYLSLAQEWAPVGEPLRIGVRSVGSGSQRWFAIHPVSDATSRQPKLEPFDHELE